MNATISARTGARTRVTRWLAALAIGAVGLGSVAVDSAAAADPTGSAAGVTPTDGSLSSIVDQIGARSLWLQGITGRGVNVAVIDTGVAPVPALQGVDKVVATVDLSGEAAVPAARYLDTYGHGTHIAGIIAGRDPGADPRTAAQHPEWFLGVAPDAGIVSVKVGNNTGAVDVSQVIAAVDWVVENAAALKIRVITLAYGSGSTLGYTSDPLAYAVERAWKAGIVVVAAAGNDGRGARTLDMPARDPYVISVAAVERRDATGFRVPTWVTSGDGVRNPDLSAPGRSVVSLRVPGSRIDVDNPAAAVGQYLFKGSGSSQATAVVAGAAALLLSARPTLTPDQVKQVLTGTASADAVTPRSEALSGKGLVQVAAANAAVPTGAVQNWPRSTGTGSLEAARGDDHVVVNGTVVQGEVTVLGSPWLGGIWTGPRWSGGSWNKTEWSGASWMGTPWTDAYWTGAAWLGKKWNGLQAPVLATGWGQIGTTSWYGVSWGGVSWGGVSWGGVSWGGVSWGGVSWGGVSWGGVSWG